MAFLNALGRVSRVGQWRLRLVLRASFSDGSLDATDDGLVDLSACDPVVVSVTPRPASLDGCEPAPVLFASSADGTLVVSNPGILEAVFPAGWSAHVPPGLYDVRVLATIGPETACLYDQPVDLR